MPVTKDYYQWPDVWDKCCWQKAWNCLMLLPSCNSKDVSLGTCTGSGGLWWVVGLLTIYVRIINTRTLEHIDILYVHYYVRMCQNHLLCTYTIYFQSLRLQIQNTEYSINVINCDHSWGRLGPLYFCTMHYAMKGTVCVCCVCVLLWTLPQGTLRSSAIGSPTYLRELAHTSLQLFES